MALPLLHKLTYVSPLFLFAQLAQMNPTSNNFCVEKQYIVHVTVYLFHFIASIIFVPKYIQK